MSTIARLTWGARDYEIGLDRGVLYPGSAPGQAWDGLISVNETPSDSENKANYVDGLRRKNRQTTGHFAGTLNAYSYPQAFFDDILIQTRPKSFGLCYRTMTREYYRIHIVYNIALGPSQYIHQQSTSETYSWPFTALPVDIPGAKRSAHLVVETAVAYSWVVQALEDILYGTEGGDARLPSPQEIVDLFESLAILRITDNGNGTWTANTDRTDIITMLDANTFQISWPSAVYISADTYNLSTL